MEWLENDGMGVLGYTWAQVQEMPLDALKRAINSRHKNVASVMQNFLEAVFGKPDVPTPKTSQRVMTPELFDALFA